MTVISWVPNTHKEYDTLFNSLREKQYTDHSHRYWNNYHVSSFSDTILHTICFNDAGDPELCSSVSSRPCWPKNVYRILNRTWKVINRKLIMRQISPAMGHSTISQINWLKENTDCKLYFISRQTNNWTDWVIDSYKKDYNLDFTAPMYKYLTCPNECDDTCWQHIVYNGDEILLNHWKHK